MDDGSSCSRNLGDGLSSDDDDVGRDGCYGDGTVTAEEDLSVQMEVFGSPEVGDEAAAASVLPAPFSRTARVGLAFFYVIVLPCEGISNQPVGHPSEASFKLLPIHFSEHPRGCSRRRLGRA